MGLWDISVCTLLNRERHANMCIYVFCCKNVCAKAETDTETGLTQYFWHTDKALEAIRVNNIQQTGEACLDSPASPLWFDKIVLATTLHRLRLQTVTYCPGNCCREHVRQINSFLIIHLAQFIYSMASQQGRKRG